MSKRIKVGLIYSYNENWIGGTYYTLNLIAALKSLPQERQPHLVILLGTKVDQDLIEKLNYPFIEFHIIKHVYSSLVIRGINKVWRLFIQNQNIIRPYIQASRIDVIFGNSFSSYFRKIKKKIYWIPDFQEHFYPEFFSKEEIEARREYQSDIAYNNNDVVFSSEAAQKHFENIYHSSNANTYVLNFAVTHPKYDDISIEGLHHKYNLSSKYFFSPNQFWVHKNHWAIIKAIDYLKKNEGLSYTVLFSGKEYDYRNPDYTQELKLYVSENGLEQNIIFLGFIDRMEQLKLMSNASAIIQPSFFEGWSTVVEDAKAMNKAIIASNIEVHQEQLGASGNYFDPQDFVQLASLLKLAETKQLKTFSTSYTNKIFSFGSSFIDIIKAVNGD